MEEPTLNKQEAKEVLKKFTYVDNSIPNQQTVIFDCVAKDIAEADKLFKNETGKTVAREPLIGCQISEAEPKDLKLDDVWIEVKDESVVRIQYKIKKFRKVPLAVSI